MTAEQGQPLLPARVHFLKGKLRRSPTTLFLFTVGAALLWMIYYRDIEPKVIYLPAKLYQPAKPAGAAEEETSPETTPATENTTTEDTTTEDTATENTTTEDTTTEKTTQFPPDLPIPAFEVPSLPRDYALSNVHSSHDNMFFVESSCVFNITPKDYKNNGGLHLTIRTSCAVYSAALMHPHRKIYVLHTCPITTDYYNSSEEWVKRVLEMENVNIIQIGSDVERWFKGTPLEGIHTSLAKSKWPPTHSCDALRFLTLWKYGGTYLDSDFIVTKPLDELGVNWAVAPSNQFIANGLMNFQKGHQVVQRVVEIMKDRHNPTGWVSIGPGLFTEVVNEKCNLTRRGPFGDGLGYMEDCDFTVYGHGISYAINYGGHRSMFERKAWERMKQSLSRSLLVHFWNNLNSNNKVEEGSAYDRLATVFCHNVYVYHDSNSSHSTTVSPVPL